MFGKVLATVFFVTMPTVQAFQDARPEGTTTAPVEVGVLLQSTSIRIRNFADVDQVLIFKGEGLKIYRMLYVGTELDWSFAPHALDGVSMEVASLSAGAWRYTGSLSLSDYALSGSDTLWVQPFTPHSLSWLQFDASFALFSSGPSMMPSYLQDCAAGNMADSVPDPAAMHVPGPTPSQIPPVDGPPKLDKNPIPLG
jgi:hypothetical protein